MEVVIPFFAGRVHYDCGAYLELSLSLYLILPLLLSRLNIARVNGCLYLLLKVLLIIVVIRGKRINNILEVLGEKLWSLLILTRKMT